MEHTTWRIVERIARAHGVSPEEVYVEMQSAIDQGFFRPDASVRAAWDAIPFSGAYPTPEDVIRYAAQLVLQKDLS